jgi:4-amino-4-deoxy-L-arabinose transferase-like glycosyltransferase
LSRWVPYLAAALLVCAASSTASRLPLFDPDEGYYPATAAESVDQGRWWDLRFNGEPRWEKPILAYGLIEGAFAAFGRSVTSARLPSALEGAALVLLVGLLLGRLVSTRSGAATALVLATTLGVQTFARAAHPEIAVVLSIAVTQLLLTMWLVVPRAGRIRGWALWTGLSLGYGLLAKGPVAVVVPMIAVACAAPFVIDLRARWREALGDAAIAGLVALVVAAPWYVAMTSIHGVEFLRVAVWVQNVGRFAGQMADHGQSAGVFALAAAAGLLPWIGLLPAALARVRRPSTSRREAVRFVLVVTAASSLVFYSMSASKLASYSLALIPPLSALIGMYLDDVLDGVRGSATAAFRWAGGVLAAIATALIAIPLLHGTAFRTRDLIGGVPAADAADALWSLVTPMMIVFAAGAIALFVLPLRGRIAALTVSGTAAPLAALLAAAPMLGDAYPWQRFGAQIARDPGPASIQMYRAPSLTFFARQPIRIVNEDELRDILGQPGFGWVVLGADWADKPELSARLAAAGAEVIERSPRLILVKLR